MSVVVSSSSQRPAANQAGAFLERLGRRVDRVRTHFCLGIDPDPQALPDGFSPAVAGIEAFSRLLIEAASPFAAAIKANIAFFEAFGSDGIAALERLRAAIPSEIPFIVDAKRADVSSTVARQAVALFDSLGADAVTASPYMGREAIEPLLDRTDRFVYVLCRTSNPGAGEFQDLALGGEPLYVHVARRVSAWAAAGDQVGLVVGATAPSELATIRSAGPTLPILVPGLGAQGGDIGAVLTHGPATSPPASAVTGGGLVISVSRAIAAEALRSADPGEAIVAAAQGWAGRLRC